MPRNLIVDNKMMLYGDVGDLGYWYEDGADFFTSMDIIKALAAYGSKKPIDVHINSGGGAAYEGIAIANALRSHKGEVTCYNDAVAASAASIIFAAGDQSVMSTGSTLMIHDPSGVTLGTERDHQKSIESLNALGDAMAELYAEKTGSTTKAMRDIMREETWYVSEEAVKAKFADKMDKAAAKAVAAFDYRLYARAPEPMRELAAINKWNLRAKIKTNKETNMTPEEMKAAADKAAAEKAAAEKATADKAAADKAAADATAKLANDQALADATKTEQARCSAISALCATEGVPNLAAALITEGATVEQAKARLANAKDIRAAVAMAQKSCPAIEASVADTYIAAGTSVDGVRSDLFKRIVAAQSVTETRSQNGDHFKPDKPRVDLVADMKRRSGIKE